MLTNTTEIKVRFSEVDSMAIVWHGHYLKYFEDGRENFGKAYGLGYLDVYEKHGFLIPIVKIDCSYKRPIRYTDEVLLETRYVDSQAAKIIFEYKLYKKKDGEIFATGRSEQVFLDKSQQLQLTTPGFFDQWKLRWNIKSEKLP